MNSNDNNNSSSDEETLNTNNNNGTKKKLLNNNQVNGFAAAKEIIFERKLANYAQTRIIYGGVSKGILFTV